jgi:large subunit ribosomal protein L17
MRHQKAGKKLNRTGSHRNAMFRNMVTSLFQHGRIQTTDAKAKELRRWADRMVTLAKRGDLHARRQALAVMRDKAVVHKLFEEAAARFSDRMGGYAHVVKIGRRRGDAAPISLVELVAAPEKKERKKKPKAAKKAADKPKRKAEGKAKEKKEAKKAEAAKKAEEKTEPKKKEEVKAEEPTKAEVAEQIEGKAAPEVTTPEAEAEVASEKPEAEASESAHGTEAEDQEKA